MLKFIYDNKLIFKVNVVFIQLDLSKIEFDKEMNYARCLLIRK